MSAERRIFVDASASAFGTAREPARILTPTPARELASDVLRREGIARPVTLYEAVRMGSDSALTRAFDTASPDRIATTARIPR
jgi:hypothetical protein